MRSKLLISTAALLAGIAVASAQTMSPGGAGPLPGTGASPGGAQDRPQSQPREKQSQDRGAQPGQDKGKAQQGAQDRPAPAQRGQKDQTTGQGERGQGQGQRGQEQGQPQRGQREQSQQAPREPQGQQGQRDQQGQPPRAQQGQPDQGGSVTLTTEQRTRIRETVIAGGNAPRVSSVNFSVRVGTVVPQTVRVVVVPSVLVEVYPQYRGRKYFVYEDQIIIVDDDNRIVAVISV